jgi:hypothetical protein
MPTQKETLIQRSFGSGELAPALHARADQATYAAGLRQCRNFLVRRSGGVANRPGTRFIEVCKTASPTVQLLPYLSEIAGDSVLIENGAGYFRFFKNGAAVTVAGVAAWSAVTSYVIGDLVVEAGVNYYAKAPSLNQVPPNATFWHPLTADIYEVPSPFGANLPYWSQSGRIITLTHESAAMHELEFVNLTLWIMRPVVTEPSIAEPENPVLTPGGGPGPGSRQFAYQITAALAETYEESEPSAKVVAVGINEPTPDDPHVLTWDPVAGAAEYYVYCDPYGNETFGLIGTATGVTQFNDVGFVPDFAVTPPLPRAPFATSNNFPKVSASYQQRRIVGYTNVSPDAIFGSRVGFRSNFGISSPLQDDDAITFKIAGTHHHPVRHIVGLKDLIILTDAGAFIVTGGQDGVLAPNTINPEQMTYNGVNPVKPVVIGNALVYLQARGSVLYDLRFDQQVEGLGGRDLTILSSHLFDGHTIRRMDFAQIPDSTVWAVREDGVLLGLTYIRELDVWGWHRHDTDGFFWEVCVVPEGGRDSVYFIVRRTIDGNTVRYIERLESREIINFDVDAYFVDAGLSYSGAPVNNVTGLDHLEDEIVAVVGDGAVIFDGNPSGLNAANFLVTGGTLPVNLPASYSNIHVGMPIRFAEIETLDLDVGGAAVRDKMKKIGPVTILVDSSSRSFMAGPDVSHLRRYAPPPFEPAADAFTGQIEVNTTTKYDKYGRVFIRQTDPLPLTILGVLPYTELGG